MNTKVEPNLLELEKSLTFAPPAARGIHELIREAKDFVNSAQKILDLIEKRLAEFDRLQTHFYNGREP